MKLQRHTIVLAALVVTLIGAAVVTKSVRASAATKAPEPARPALTVSIEAPLRSELPHRFTANGSVSAWQEAIIGAEAHGLRLSAVHVNVGDIVRRGQVLAAFAPETTQAALAQINAGVAEAEAGAAEAAANAERARTLQATGALSAQQINQYLTAEQTAKARLEAQRAAAKAQQLRLGQTQVLASDHGVISARSATVGAVVSAGQELFRMIRMGRLEWRAEVTSAELVRVQVGTEASIVAADGAIVKGTVRMIAPTIDPQTRSGIVYVDLPNSPALKAGMFARGDFDLGRSLAFTVPQQAIVVRDGFSYVFRLQADQRVTQVKVRTGRRDGERIEVLEGLASGATLVTNGAGFLNDGDLVKVATARLPEPDRVDAAMPQPRHP